MYTHKHLAALVASPEAMNIQQQRRQDLTVCKKFGQLITPRIATFKFVLSIVWNYWKYNAPHPYSGVSKSLGFDDPKSGYVEYWSGSTQPECQNEIIINFSF
mmetsp:Transcript_12026/g.28777  ORF Transcript_12026/g.28777 Transcript_12026/m.28777 type:complete len:102 (+) Transcript_12026:180-485(+)